MQRHAQADGLCSRSRSNHIVAKDGQLNLPCTRHQLPSNVYEAINPTYATHPWL